MKALIVPARGIGDALLMSIAAYRLSEEGYVVTTYHPSLSSLSTWFPTQYIVKDFPIHPFDLILIENDNSPQMHHWKSHFPQSVIFYPSYHPNKNPPLTAQDYLFNPHQTMAQNIAQGIEKLLGLSLSMQTYNGIAPPTSLKHRHHVHRVIIHPTSSQHEKNWPQHKFLTLKSALLKKGLSPIFVMDPIEKEQWGEDATTFETLSDLAGFVYESGYVIGNDSLLGHLGSNLGIPTLIIANDQERMQLWRPGWLPGEVITPPAWIPNTKFLRLRKNHWHCFIPSWRVLSIFERQLQNPTHTFQQSHQLINCPPESH